MAIIVKLDRLLPYHRECYSVSRVFAISVKSISLCLLCLLFSFASITLAQSSSDVAANKKAKKPLETVADLRYGVVLYEYFQDNYFDALSELLVADERGGIKGHGENPELIAGGIHLAFGMDQTAEDIFLRLLDSSRPLNTRNAAWFYLAKVRYQRGQWDKANESLDNVEGDLSAILDEELSALRIQLLVRTNQLDAADQLLQKKEQEKRIISAWRPYINFNLGAAYARQGRYADSILQFNTASKERLVRKNIQLQEQQLALYDKALTAAGYSYFLDKKYTEAIGQFKQVRRNSVFSNDALLGYGWAATRLENYQLALTPWLLLSERSLVDDAAQESLLAIPYAYEKISQPKRALDSYLFAEKTYTEEMQRIDEVAFGLSNQSLVELLDLDNEEANTSWLIPDPSTAIKPKLNYLNELFALNRFQNSVQTIRDLYQLKKRLQKWQIDLDAYSDLLNYRLTRHRTPEELNKQAGLKTLSLSLQEQRDRLANIIERADKEQDVFLLMNEEQRELFDILQRGEKALAALKSAKDASETMEEETQWLKRYRGILLWDATNQFDDRLWQAKQELQEVNESIEKITATQQIVESLLTDAPDIQASQDKITALSLRLDDQLASNDIAMAGMEEELRQQVRVELGRQRQRLQFYLAEARLSVARLYDKQLLEQQ